MRSECRSHGPGGELLQRTAPSCRVRPRAARPGAGRPSGSRGRRRAGDERCRHDGRSSASGLTVSEATVLRRSAVSESLWTTFVCPLLLMVVWLIVSGSFCFRGRRGTPSQRADGGHRVKLGPRCSLVPSLGTFCAVTPVFGAESRSVHEPNIRPLVIKSAVCMSHIGCGAMGRRCSSSRSSPPVSSWRPRRWRVSMPRLHRRRPRRPRRRPRPRHPPRRQRRHGRGRSARRRSRAGDVNGRSGRNRAGRGCHGRARSSTTTRSLSTRLRVVSTPRRRDDLRDDDRG